MFDKLKNQDKWLLFSASLYTLVFIIFYPPFYTTIDEQHYLRLAYLLRKGSIVILDPFYRYGFIFNGRGYVSLYPVGQSILLLPFTLFTLRGAFLSGLFLHLMGFFIFYKLLRRLGEEEHNALLFLFFPYYIYYSTTLLSGFSSSFFILLAFYFYISKNRKDHVISGVFFGMACLIRYTNLLVFLPFAGISLFKNRTRLKYLLWGFAPLALFILFYNYTYYGGIFSTGYGLWLKGLPDEGSLLSVFSLRTRFFTYLPWIVYRLLIIYPLMFLAPFFYKKEGRAEILITTILFLLFYTASGGSGKGYGLMPSTLTRYLLPIIPLYLITYIPFYENMLKKIHIPSKPTFIVAIIFLFIGSVFILGGQQRYLDQQYQVSKEIYSNTNDHSLIISGMDIARYLMEPFGDRKFVDRDPVEDASVFFDNNTYLVFREVDKKIIEEKKKDYASQLELIYSNSYEKGLMSRSYKMEIYRVKI